MSDRKAPDAGLRVVKNYVFELRDPQDQQGPSLLVKVADASNLIHAVGAVMGAHEGKIILGIYTEA